MGRHSVMRSLMSLAAVLVLLAIPFVGMAQEDGALLQGLTPCGRTI